MTTTAIDAVGFCAHYSRQGDWAFEFALGLASRHNKKLNIFHFLEDPYDPRGSYVVRLTPAELERYEIEREKELRLYYDSRLGDYLDAGFRLCDNDEWTELHRCLCKREFQILVLALPSYEATFAGVPLVEFADHFICPLVLVGPGSAEEKYLNSPAALLADKLGLGRGSWIRIAEAGSIFSSGTARVTSSGERL
jgi:hypothetical protein